tara:strand:- start:5884 stop:6060 length:177 start_codon:yes stop_codon:yes gene_type:complete
MITVEQQMEDYEEYGLITASCMVCGTECQTEVDNPEAFCDLCGRIVEVHNHIVNQGMV